MPSNFLKLNQKDFIKGLVMAVIGGCVLPILVALQSPDFSFATLNWHALWTLAETGAISGFSSYLIKNLFSDSEGKVLGRIG